MGGEGRGGRECFDTTGGGEKDPRAGLFSLHYHHLRQPSAALGVHLFPSGCCSRKWRESFWGPELTHKHRGRLGFPQRRPHFPPPPPPCTDATADLRSMEAHLTTTTTTSSTGRVASPPPPPRLSLSYPDWEFSTWGDTGGGSGALPLSRRQMGWEGRAGQGPLVLTERPLRVWGCGDQETCLKAPHPDLPWVLSADPRPLEGQAFDPSAPASPDLASFLFCLII